MKKTRTIVVLVLTLTVVSFLALPELRARAANTIFSADITDGEVKTVDLASNSVTAAKIKDGEVKASEIATDAVGASEIAGVRKLIFDECKVTSEIGSIVVAPGGFLGVNCPNSGVDADDLAIATNVDGADCFGVTKANVHDGWVQVFLVNHCSFQESFGTNRIAIIAYDK